MTAIRASCDNHADQVEMSPEEVKVVVDLDGRFKDIYRFMCPLDGCLVIKDSEPRITELLVEHSGCQKLEYHSDVSTHVEEHRQIGVSDNPDLYDLAIDFGLLSEKELPQIIEDELSLLYKSSILLFRQQHGLS